MRNKVIEIMQHTSIFMRIRFVSFFKQTSMICMMCVVLFLSACSSKQRYSVSAPSSQATAVVVKTDAITLWEQFILLKPISLSPKPYVLSGSLRVGYPNELRRVTYIMWSNGDLPLRVDFQAGVGASIASIEESTNQLRVFLPQNDAAYVLDSKDTHKFLQHLGISVPFNFKELSVLLRGRFEVFSDAELLDIIINEETEDLTDRYLYIVKLPKLFLEIRLNNKAMPVYFKINKEWELAVAYDDTDLPYKLTFHSLVSEYKGIMLVKDREIKKEFTPDNLEVKFPAGIPIQRFFNN